MLFIGVGQRTLDIIVVSGPPKVTVRRQIYSIQYLYGVLGWIWKKSLKRLLRGLIMKKGGQIWLMGMWTFVSYRM